MKRRQKITLTLLAAAIIGIGAMTTSYATDMGMGPGGGCAMAGKKMAHPARIDSKLAEMKEILKIGSEQEEAWATFAKTMKQLYAVLTPQQKEVLDSRFGQDMPMQL